MKRGMFGVAVLVALAGCDDGVRLDAFDERKPEFELSVNPDASSVTVTLSAGTHEDSCPTFSSSVHAELNGMPMRFVERGGERGGFWTGYCANPTFTLDMNAAPSLSAALEAPATTLHVSDGERTWVAEVEYLCNRRSLRFISPASGVLHPGEHVEVELEPATDTFFQIPDGSGPDASFVGSPWLAEDVEFEGNRLRFTVPRVSPPLEGPRVLSVSIYPAIAPFRRHVSRCEGFSRCNFDCGQDQSAVTASVQMSP